jgi:hypothetical protein
LSKAFKTKLRGLHEVKIVALSRNSIVVLVIIGILGLVLYFGADPQPSESKAKAAEQVSNENDGQETKPNQFAGYDCTGDCSGHEAGYRWAEEHDITDGDDCETAGEHSNSPSFAEGCQAYVDGESHGEEAQDPEDEN